MLDYVLVSDVSDNGQLYYYCGYFKDATFQKDDTKTMKVPANSNDYVKAMKIAYRMEAEEICKQINDLKNVPFKYHVEQHMYSTFEPNV